MMGPTRRYAVLLASAALLGLTPGCRPQTGMDAAAGRTAPDAPRPSATRPSAAPHAAAASPVARLVAGCRAQTRVTHSYDPAYTAIPYPGGDVDPGTGVCSDVVVRGFRAAGVDLQRLVHEDMRAHFGAYPALWGLRRPDPNIDHRRVANLMRFFARRGRSVPLPVRPGDVMAGDVVAWRLPGGRLHIGVVTGAGAAGGGPSVVHNIGAGTREEDVLFAWPVIGHYRWFAPGRGG